MKQIFNSSILFLLIVFVSCQKEVNNTPGITSINSLNAKASTSGTSGNINLKVEVSDATGNKILSDGGGAYINASQLVQAQILSSDGNFYLNTNSNTAKASIRSMQFNLQNGVNGDGTPSSTVPPNTGGQANYSIQTNQPYTASINNSFGGTKYLQNMDPNGGQQYMQFRVWGEGLKGVVNWKLVWKNGYESDMWNVNSISDYVLVTRNADVWTIVPANYNAPGYQYAALHPGQNDSQYVLATYYSIPFKMTLTKIN